MVGKTATPNDALPYLVTGSQVVVRDEEWLIRSTQDTPADGRLVRCIGLSPLVRDTEATFLTTLDRIEPLRPEDTELVLDESPGFRRSRLYLEAVLRKTPIPATDHGLAVTPKQLLEPLEYQRRAAHKALTTLRPRLLIADAVGLGKDARGGMVLSELILVGAGATRSWWSPRGILEQFQHELWTRFAIPAGPPDSEGIHRMRRQIPANRNPSTKKFRRAIISIDTLKNAGRYRHHLEGIPLGRGGHRRVPQPGEQGHAQQPARPGAGGCAPTPRCSPAPPRTTVTRRASPSSSACSIPPRWSMPAASPRRTSPTSTCAATRPTTRWPPELGPLVPTGSTPALAVPASPQEDELFRAAGRRGPTRNVAVRRCRARAAASCSCNVRRTVKAALSSHQCWPRPSSNGARRWPVRRLARLQ
ncbi:MAG: hypothetical protein R2749_17495 [Acidimicrobiales bacterium]